MMRHTLPVLLAATWIACASPEAPRADRSSPAGAGAGAPPGSDRTPSAPIESPLSLPDLTSASEDVQAQLRDQFASLQQVLESGASPADRGRAYGEMGRLLMATEYLAAAETAFLNARALQPDQMQWSYYLGHLRRARNDLVRAAAFFQEALHLAPGDLPSMVWLGDTYLAENRGEEAERVLTDARMRHPESVAVLYRLGLAAAQRGNHARAVELFEQGLAADPTATGLHYPLAQSYRELGQTDKAQAHLDAWQARDAGDAEIAPADPLIEGLGGLLRNARAYVLRGDEAVDRRDWPEAVTQFTRAVELDPNDSTARLNLGTALYLTGDASAALEQYRAAVALEPALARAHFGIALIMAASGRDDVALEEFAVAVSAEPSYLEARLAFAETLRRTGRLEEAITHYTAVLEQDSGLSQAAFGRAMALVRMGRYGDARRRLTAAADAYPDQPGFAHALARVLAAAPDDAVRDGRRALALVQPLVAAAPQSVAVAETMAMAYAELGQFDDAVRWQRQTLVMAQDAGLSNLAGRLVGNLDRYERAEPCRVPWAEDDPVFFPRPEGAGVASP